MTSSSVPEIAYRVLARLRRRVPLLGSRRLGPLRRFVFERLLHGRADRVYLERVLLPFFASGRFQRVLFVGTERYTRRYGRPFRTRHIEFWTVDIDPVMARWGEPGRHRVADITLDTGFDAASFDAMLMNGVFGFGVDDVPSMERAMRNAHRLLRAGGVLLIGWNPARASDASMLEATRELFAPLTPEALEQRRRIEHGESRYEHVYDLYEARPATEASPAPR